MLTWVSGGMPFDQADASTYPSRMLTSVITSPTATVPVPWQSPTHATAGAVPVTVGVPAIFADVVGVADGIAVPVPTAWVVAVGVCGTDWVLVPVGIPVAAVGLTNVLVAVATLPPVGVLVGVAGEPVVVDVAVLVGTSVPVVGVTTVPVSVAVAPAGTVGVSVGVEAAVGSGTTICPSVHVVASGAPAESVEFATINPAPEHDNGNACPLIALGEIATEQV